MDITALPPIGQVGIVVRDVEKAVEWYSRLLGIGPWTIVTNSAPPAQAYYHGEPSSYRVKVAHAYSGPLEIELIQYLEGDSLHRDFLAGRGEGIEHIALRVPDRDEAVAHFTSMGIEVLQSAEGLGASRDGRYAYLDTRALLGTMLELSQWPSRLA